MKLSPEEQEKLDQFEITYGLANDPVRLEAERRVLGSDYGANSFTTVTQALDLIGELGLGQGSRLLDLGTGAGYPGLLIAGASNCSVVLTDMPLAGLRMAKDRALKDEVDGHVVQASGTAPPFADGSFDAVQHSDVLC